MTSTQHHTTDRIEGRVGHPIFSPKGGIEGLFLDVAGSPLQLVIDKHDEALADEVAALRNGTSIAVEATRADPSDKGNADHPVWHLRRLVEKGGKKTMAAKSAEREREFSGIVTRLNYARHGQANGLVLDSGDFIHVKPAGFNAIKAGVGDHVNAFGTARPLTHGGGFAVEASRVNGHVVTKKGKPKHG